MKNLIIGKNSRIVKSILSDIIGFDVISHTEVAHTDFSNYAIVYLFSFSLKSAQENIDVIDKIPPSKLVYISTVATYSLLLRRQWARYPNLKKQLEHYVFDRGSKILRLGVWDDQNHNKISRNYQCTKAAALIQHLNTRKTCHRKIVDLYCVRLGKGKVDTRLKKIYFYLDSVLPNYFFLKAPLVFAFRKCNLADYGYSGDAFSLCNLELVIGEGCFGSAYLSNRKADSIVISPSGQAVTWTKKGFSNTLISLRRFGLSELWHRVYVDRSGGKAVKRFDLRRHKHHARRVNGAVLALDLEHKVLKVGKPETIIKSLSEYKCWNTEDDFHFEIAFSKVTLAAGTLINAVLLEPYVQGKAFALSDHKTFFVGSVNNLEVPEKFSKFSNFFMKHISFDDFEFAGKKCLVDYRPLSADSSGAIYRNGVFTIIFKLIASRSISRINEAFYNRYKMAIKTNEIGLWAQVEDKQSIEIVNGEFSRTSNIDSKAIISAFEARYNTFSRAKNISPTDSQHIVWAPTIMNDLYRENISSGVLKILGSKPEGYNLGLDHHTVKIRNQILMEKLLND